MKKIIQVNDVILTVVAGGCWCACLSKPFSFTNPTVQLGEALGEEDCYSKCYNKGLVYNTCGANPPRRWEPTSEFIKRLEVQKQV